MNTYPITRREALAAVAGAGVALLPALTAMAKDEKRLFKIGAGDWCLRLEGNPSALELAAQIGLDGVEISFGPPGGRYDLRKQDVRRQYLEAAKKHEVKIASLAMGDLNAVPYSSDPRAQRWVEECVRIMPKLNQKIVLLAFFQRGDIKDKPDLQKEVIRRLKLVAPAAEKAGVVLGLETYLNAQEHMRLLDAVGSPSVQVYYDVANMERRGYDIYKEIRRLGRDRICQIHCKEYGFLLGKGRIDFVKVKQAVDEIGWQGWLVIESAVGKGKTVFDSYVHNQKYLRSVFPTRT